LLNKTENLINDNLRLRQISNVIRTSISPQATAQKLLSPAKQTR